MASPVSRNLVSAAIPPGMWQCLHPPSMSGNTDAKELPASPAPASGAARSGPASGGTGRGPRSRSAQPISSASAPTRHFNLSTVDCRLSTSLELIDHRRPEEVVVDLVRLLEVDEV